MKRVFLFFNDTATTEIYTLSLHDALPIWVADTPGAASVLPWHTVAWLHKRKRIQFEPLGTDATTRLYLAYPKATPQDRKSTRLNSSHANISYAVFCLKKKK